MKDQLIFPAPTKSDLESLEDLVVDHELNELEKLTAGFNIFESIGAVRREARHSDFLSFLLNPLESHGLSDRYLKLFLFDILKRNCSASDVSAISVDLIEPTNIEIRREWENIDILIFSEQDRFVCAIENKIDTSEYDNQLNRHEDTLSVHFPNYSKLFVYLTIDENQSDNNEKWLPYTYGNIHDFTRPILSEAKGDIGEDIYIYCFRGGGGQYFRGCV